LAGKGGGRESWLLILLGRLHVVRFGCSSCKALGLEGRGGAFDVFVAAPAIAGDEEICSLGCDTIGDGSADKYPAGIWRPFGSYGSELNAGGV
jgi:hypothetical protein